MADGNEKKTSARATNIKLKAGTKKPQDKLDLPDVSERGKGNEKLSMESKPKMADGNEKKTSARARNIKLKAGTKVSNKL
ncbi:hypothetical protein TNCV_684001 [Trichonephila clavipes]|nr:hypothetical protein TNCV_684001 [Trichonephila clavipes]